MKTIEVKLNDYNSPTELPSSIIDLLNEENILLNKIRMVEENKVIIRKEILQKEGDAYFDEESWELLLEEAEKRSITIDKSPGLKRISVKDKFLTLLKKIQ